MDAPDRTTHVDEVLAALREAWLTYGADSDLGPFLASAVPGSFDLASVTDAELVKDLRQQIAFAKRNRGEAPHAAAVEIDGGADE